MIAMPIINVIKMVLNYELEKYERTFIDKYIKNIGYNVDFNYVMKEFNVELKKCIFSVSESREKKKSIISHMRKMFANDGYTSSNHVLRHVLRHIIDNNYLLLLSKFLSQCTRYECDVQIFSDLSTAQLEKVIDSFILNKINSKVFINLIPSRQVSALTHTLSDKYKNDLVNVFPEYIIENMNRFSNDVKYVLLSLEKVKFRYPCHKMFHEGYSVYNTVNELYKIGIDDFLSANPDLLSYYYALLPSSHLPTHEHFVANFILSDKNVKMHNIRQAMFVFRNSNVPKYFTKKKIGIISDVIFVY